MPADADSPAREAPAPVPPSAPGSPGDAPRTIRIRDGRHQFSYAMPAKSLATFRWNPQNE